MYLLRLLISESCCGRQRLSLKIVIYSRVWFITAYIMISVNKATIWLLVYTNLPNAIFHGRWITLCSLMYMYAYVYDLLLIVYIQVQCNVYTPFKGLLSNDMDKNYSTMRFPHIETVVFSDQEFSNRWKAGL